MGGAPQNTNTNGLNSAQMQNNALQALVAQALGNPAQTGYTGTQTSDNALNNSILQNPKQAAQAQNFVYGGGAQSGANQQLQQLLQQRAMLDQQIQALQGQLGGINGSTR